MSATTLRPSSYILNLLHTPSEALTPMRSRLFVKRLKATYGEEVVNQSYGWLLNPTEKFSGTDAFVERTSIGLLKNQELSVEDQKYIAVFVQRISAGSI